LQVGMADGENDAWRIVVPDFEFDLGLFPDVELDADEEFSFNASVSGVNFLSSDADQISTSAGATWSVSDELDLSLSALVGWLAGGDRYGLLLGVSPKLDLF
ncbi:MAG TPA: hypothetical protein VGI70_03655, partial [Polyangiales bacterium]